MNIIVDLNYPIQDGTEVKFRSPVDCSQVTGLKINHPNGSQEFVLADAHGNNVGDIDHLFAEDVVVKVILDVTKGMAFVQNADTNAYIERTFVKSVNGTKPDENGNVEVAGGGGGSADAVLYTPQTLTEAQQTQARNNIGATLDVLKALGKETKRVDNLDEVTENGFYIGNIPEYEGEWYCIAMTGSDDYKIQFCVAYPVEGWVDASMLVRIKNNEYTWWNYYEVGLDVSSYCITGEEFSDRFSSELDSCMEYITENVSANVIDNEDTSDEKTWSSSKITSYIDETFLGGEW